MGEKTVDLSEKLGTDGSMGDVILKNERREGGSEFFELVLDVDCWLTVKLQLLFVCFFFFSNQNKMITSGRKTQET